MTHSRINHEGTKGNILSCNWECQEGLLSKVIDLEAQCQALQEYNSELEESRDRYATVLTIHLWDTLYSMLAALFVMVI